MRLILMIALLLPIVIKAQLVGEEAPLSVVGTPPMTLYPSLYKSKLAAFTDNTTFKTIHTFTPDANSVGKIKVKVIMAFESLNIVENLEASYKATVVRVASGTPVVNLAALEYLDKTSSLNSITAPIQLTISGNDINVQIRGKAATDMKWVIEITREVIKI